MKTRNRSSVFRHVAGGLVRDFLFHAPLPRALFPAPLSRALFPAPLSRALFHAPLPRALFPTPLPGAILPRFFVTRLFAARALLLALCAVTLAVIGAHPAAAGEYAQSKSPYWEVGSLNQLLSDACQQREFNQIQPFRLTIGFRGPKGMAIVGVAKMGFNLYDPRRLAQPGFTYHFFNDGLSNCRVYLAGARLTQ